MALEISYQKVVVEFPRFSFEFPYSKYIFQKKRTLKETKQKILVIIHHIKPAQRLNADHFQQVSPSSKYNQINCDTKKQFCQKNVFLLVRFCARLNNSACYLNLLSIAHHPSHFHQHQK